MKSRPAKRRKSCWWCEREAATVPIDNIPNPFMVCHACLAIVPPLPVPVRSWRKDPLVREAELATKLRNSISILKALPELTMEERKRLKAMRLLLREIKASLPARREKAATVRLDSFLDLKRKPRQTEQTRRAAREFFRQHRAAPCGHASRAKVSADVACPTQGAAFSQEAA